MKKYILKRLFLVVPTLLGITFITYLMIRLAPGDYTKLQLGMEGALKGGSISREVLEQEKKLYGLDKPIIVGYMDWLLKTVTGDWGTSRKDGRPVSMVIKEKLPITLALNLISMFLIYIISIPMGILSAVKKDSLFDRGTSLVLFVLYSLPTFWVGLLLILYLGSGEHLNLFPLGGKSSDWAADVGCFTWFLDRCWHLVLPVATLTYGGFAFLARYTRANMLEVINQQYIMTARAKGLSERKVVFVHAFRNSLIPLITLMATLLPGLLGGSVIVESIFSVPGMGMLAFEAILSRNIPVIMAIETIAAVLTLAGILIADLAYALVDPRIRLEAKI
ncbi:MAG: diguanylate cyclase [Spirochaetes bacterium RBG_13_51_14]|nr:MAG: diguanylate cyclase [Spirochaetes bacterium RBG_13_51_14]